MNKFIRDVNEDYKKHLISLEKDGLSVTQQFEMLNQWLVEKNFLLKGKPFPTFLKPYFIDNRLKNHLKKTVENIMNAIEKVADLFFQGSEFEKYFEMDPLDKELAMLPTYYPRRVIQARLDAFMEEDGEIKFLEFNCDSPSGMGWHDELVRMFEKLPIIKKFKEKYDFNLEILLDNFYNMLHQKYREFGGEKGKAFAIVCNRESSIRYDVELIVEYFNKRFNYPTIYADPRDGEYDGKVFKMNGVEVGLIYRDAIQDFTDYLDEVKPTLQAIKDGKVAIVNPFASRVGGLKCVLWFMTDEMTRHLFNSEELEAINRTIPWTRFLKEKKTNYRDKTVDLVEFVRKNKDNFVLKPNRGYGGFGVTIGKDVSQSKWEEVINEALKPEQSWVVQEFVNIPSDDFPQFNGGLTFKSKNINVNFFAFNGKFGGGFVRVSDSSVINIHQGGGLIPIAYVNP